MSALNHHQPSPTLALASYNNHTPSSNVQPSEPELMRNCPERPDPYAFFSAAAFAAAAFFSRLHLCRQRLRRDGGKAASLLRLCQRVVFGAIKIFADERPLLGALQVDPSANEVATGFHG